MDYGAFVDGKLSRLSASGISGHVDLPESLFGHQAALTRWALKRGRAAVFADTGLGKTRIELAFGAEVSRYTQKPFLILCPLAVAAQTAAEGASIGIGVTICRDGEDVRPGVNVTNYDRLHRFDCSIFGGVSPDESSVIKHHDAKTFATLTREFRDTPFKLPCTATPAPNDWTELGTHAEFLGVCTRAEMLSEFFTHDGGETSIWRLKGHARQAFWQWVCSWGALIRQPSDLGFDDTAYRLPPLVLHEHHVEAEQSMNGMLFALEAQTLSERRDARRSSLSERVDECARIVNAEANEPWIVWCDLNAEGDALEAAIPGSIQIAGSDSAEFKEQAVEWFAGNRCICDAPEFRSKLAEWRKQTTNATITQPIVSAGSPSLVNISETTQMSDAPTTPPITRPTKNESLRRPQNIGPEQQLIARQSVRQSTQQILNDSSVASRNGSPPTQISDLTSACVSTASQLLTTAGCLMSRTDDAPFASPPRQETSVAVGFTSITATNQSASEDCSALSATSGLANSKTAPNFSNALHCICGHRSGRRVLVSKCSITGWGLNWQHSARMAFVGVTDSYEAYYQAVRRCWRFGQKREVHVHIFASNAEGAVVSNLKRKEREAMQMAESLSAETHDAVMQEVTGTVRSSNKYTAGQSVTIPSFLRSA